jgi:hypothetical protein
VPFLAGLAAFTKTPALSSVSNDTAIAAYSSFSCPSKNVCAPSCSQDQSILSHHRYPPPDFLIKDINNKIGVNTAIAFGSRNRDYSFLTIRALRNVIFFGSKAAIGDREGCRKRFSPGFEILAFPKEQYFLLLQSFVLRENALRRRLQ